ncbi:hypothetical protein EVAR_99438_1 [Eumeta japonica]|uniref:Uncharacterized protein n=1 Tax=Eumeta variegata TaxID=151549 RepID=A0A4C1ZEE9_EUMVA|nr:hypothetical protein EVAR_99438_1 [Eumeta japonica]
MFDAFHFTQAKTIQRTSIRDVFFRANTTSGTLREAYAILKGIERIGTSPGARVRLADFFIPPYNAPNIKASVASSQLILSKTERVKRCLGEYVKPLVPDGVTASVTTAVGNLEHKSDQRAEFNIKTPQPDTMKPWERTPQQRRRTSPPTNSILRGAVEVTYRQSHSGDVLKPRRGRNAD